MGLSGIFIWASCWLTKPPSFCHNKVGYEVPATRETLYSEAGDWLFKRDACSDAFGAGASNSNCAPSNTLCCTRTNQAFPSCQQLLGKGWCCVGNNPTDQCYVDQASDCTDPNAVVCTNAVSDNSTDVCCPRLTSCVPGYTFDSTNVRCQIQFVDLQKLAASSAALSSPSTVPQTSAGSPPVSASSSPSTSSALRLSTPGSSAVPVPAATTTPQAEQTHTPMPASSSQLPAATIAGLSVGLTLAFVIAVTCLVLYLRSRRTAKSATLQGIVSGAPTVLPYKAYDGYDNSQGGYIQQVSGPGYAPQAAADTSRHNHMLSAPVEMEATARR